MGAESKDWDLGWDDDDASSSAATSLGKTEKRLDAQRTAELASAVEAARPSLDKVPAPYQPSSDGDLTPTDEAALGACRAGVELLSTAYWIAGKSLDTIATARLFRALPHREKPNQCYTTIEDWAWHEHSLKVGKVERLRAAWEIAEELLKRGYNPPEAQVREIVPLRRRHGVMAAVGMYELVAESVEGRLTAAHLREAVAMLPGDLQLSEDVPVPVLKEELYDAITAAPEKAPAAAPSRGLPRQLKVGVERRAIALADQIGRKRIPQTEVLTHVLEAFADETDPRVFDVVLERMKQQ